MGVAVQVMVVDRRGKPRSGMREGTERYAGVARRGSGDDGWLDDFWRFSGVKDPAASLGVCVCVTLSFPSSLSPRPTSLS